MKKLILILSFSLAALGINAQEIGEDHIMFSPGMDIYNTGNRNPITIGSTIRTDLDFNYFVTDKFTLGVGFDYNTGLRRTNFSPGFRLYAGKTFFFRAKSYIDLDFDYVEAGIGLGNDFFLSDHWAIEVNGDYLIRAQTGVFRAGIALFL